MLKFLRSRPATAAVEPSSSGPDRRGLVVGAGVAGVAAVAAAVLHRQAVSPPQSGADLKAAAPADGYQVTPHVLRYYQTTRT